MKKIWVAVTAALAVLILALGVAALPAIYAAVFDAEKMVYEEEPLPDGLSEAPGLFMDRFRYPMLEEAEVLPREEREARMRDSRVALGEELYERMFRLVGLEEVDSYWYPLSVIQDGSAYLIQAAAEKDGKEYQLSAAMNEDLLPGLICCRRKKEPSEAEMQEAVEMLSEICRSGTDGLRQYIEEIDGIYENCREYWNRVIRLYSSLLPEGEAEVTEIPERVPLWDCCALGEWQVCRDGGEALLVCVMGQGSLVLYYDAVEKGFCGYRILFGDSAVL